MDHIDFVEAEARQAKAERRIAETTALRSRLDLAEQRLAAVEETLVNVGAPTHSENGLKLNANGMLVDWLAGRRDPRWIGPDPVREAREQAIRDVVVAIRRPHPSNASVPVADRIEREFLTQKDSA